jgi:NAD(P)-dependent dehydrogenase (short-subunit alcohol dehydrogenase family)
MTRERAMEDAALSGRLSDKVAIVVGAGQTPGDTLGNGRATAILFAREGARVVAVDRRGESAEETAELLRKEGGEALAVAADATDEAACHAFVATCVERFGRLDILHNNVGIGGGDAPPHRLEDAAYDHIMDVNLRAMWRTCKAAVPELRLSGNAAIVNISSLAAIASAGDLTAYKISKAGVNALTQNLALTNAKHGVRANAIMPGFIDTPMAVDAPARAHGADRAAYADVRSSIVPLGRQGTAWDVANAALFLASDEAAFVTGVVLAVDGGQAARVG